MESSNCKIESLTKFVTNCCLSLFEWMFCGLLDSYAKNCSAFLEFFGVSCHCAVLLKL